MLGIVNKSTKAMKIRANERRITMPVGNCIVTLQLRPHFTTKKILNCLISAWFKGV